MTRKHLYILLCLLGAISIASCSSSDDEAKDTIMSWAATNSQYFETAYLEALTKSKTDPQHWMVKKAYTKDKAASPQHADYVVMQLLESGGKTDSPICNDKVKVHYRGYLASSSPAAKKLFGKGVGSRFDTTWYGDELDEATAVAKEFTLNDGLVVGFNTALQHMHPGDRCLVIIPYQLGYGASSQGSIPPFSTLVFDIKLVSFTR